MAIDFEAEGLLEGLEDRRERKARLELLRRLEAEGVPLEELKRATSEGRLALLPVERALQGGPSRYTAAEVGERSGLGLDFFQAVRTALGVARPEPNERLYTDLDVDAARNIKAALDAGLPPDGILEITRVLSLGMANVAAAAGRVFAESLLRAGDTEADVAQRYAEGTGKLAPLLVTAAADVLRLHQLEQARRTAVDSAARATGRLPGAEEVTVCFADLVGFTKLGERVPADELGAVAGRLGEIASELVSPPVRLVKTIGDAAMLVSPENDPLLDTALDLVETAEDEGEGFPALHAGVARGEALTRAGDWYGAPVNLASRLTDFALPSSVVAAEAVRDVAARDYRWSFAGKRRFKGVKGEIAVFRVRRPEPEAG